MTLWRQWVWNLVLWLTRNKPAAEPIEFRGEVRKIRNLLVHLPVDFDSADWERLHERLISHFEGCKITVVAREGLSDDVVEKTKVMSRVHEINLLGERDFGWRENLRNTVINRLRQNSFDIVLDYNRSFDLAMAYALNAVGAPITAGMHTDPVAERFYNLLVHPGHSSPTDDALFDCLSRLR